MWEMKPGTTPQKLLRCLWDRHSLLYFDDDDDDNDVQIIVAGKFTY